MGTLTSDKSAYIITPPLFKLSFTQVYKRKGQITMENQNENTLHTKGIFFLKNLLRKFFSIIYLAILSEAVCDFIMLTVRQFFMGYVHIYHTNHGVERYTPVWHLVLGIIMSFAVCLIYKISIPKFLNIKSIDFIDYMLTSMVIYRIGFYIFWLAIINTRY